MRELRFGAAAAERAAHHGQDDGESGAYEHDENEDRALEADQGEQKTPDEEPDSLHRVL